ncbi:very-long-chain (3R)-3-hydroxyacyl-CoA dehydratase 3 [Lutzomyia longipalpis]|uniref:very-long-chain (3R)-3-hydroxyacyl-CoA dehydratase 3 n=1 Tax=Lutzomyia longipalpis TaxID=7200 RepID=UPI002483C015|nr:very-long-chain (3R)-3-hydroxyacyl-CoA dehydratase 3 [Lutzomyia longipalpis]
MQNSLLNPLVFWSQTEGQISLKVDLKDSQVDDFTCTGSRINFQATGRGASGSQEYGFTLELFGNVSPDECKFTTSDARVDISLKKVTPSWWPQLCPPGTEKLHFLKIDFDKWKSGEDETESDEEKARLDDQRDILADYPDVLQRLQTQELGYRKEQGKKVYLALYNLLQFVGFLYIVTVLGLRLARDGHEATHEAYEAVGKAFKFCQLMQFLEVLHPMFGYTKGGVLAPLMQTTGRAVVLFLAIDTDERVQRLTIVAYLFLVWAIVELVRYPHYLMRLVGVHVAQLEWLRYTLWIPLYPLGALYETLVLLRAAEFMEATDRFAVRLPNKWNVTFDMALAIRIYVLVAILPGVSYLMSMMQKARRKRLRSRSKKLA